MTEQEVIEQIKQGVPFKDMGNIQVLGVEVNPRTDIFSDPNIRPDLIMSVQFSDTKFQIYGEIKTQVTPKTLKELTPWLARLRALAPKQPYVLICPYLSPESQKYCVENQIDFIDLCGNIVIRVPNSLIIVRLDRPNIYKERISTLRRNPFGGVSSRVLRVLLQSPMPRIIDNESRKSPIPLQKGQWWKVPRQGWSITDIGKELIQESARQNRNISFQISMSSISKTIESLEEELLVRRDGMKIQVPDPGQMLFRWAEKYQQQYKWSRYPKGAQYAVEAWECNNPFGLDIKSSVQGLRNQFPNLQTVVTGSAAASLTAPFVNIDQIDVFILYNFEKQKLLDFTANTKESKGPKFLFRYPYDQGVAMYAREIDGLNVVSDIQAYLDCYARGGRDAKQAEYLLTNIIEKQWNKK